MSRILVLGASGFVGRNAAEWFANKGHEVVRHGLNRASYSYPDEKWIKADLLAPKAVDYESFDVVIQCAAATSGCKDTLLDPALHIANNAVMNSYVLKECAAAKVKHVIFPSCSVMFESKDFPQKETDWDGGKPLNPAYLGFASTKIYCENLCQFYANISDTKFTVMRSTNYYGQYDKYDPDKSHVFGATVRKVMAAQKPRLDMNAGEAAARYEDESKIVVWGTGNEARDFLHIDNFCSFVEAAIEKQTAKYALYNVGSGTAVKINELVQAIINHSGKQLTIEHDLSKPTIPTSLCLDTSKAKAELGWEPTVSLYGGIGLTVAWYKENYAG